MSKTYKVTGINLKGMPLGESDRLLTILTPELGLIRAVVPGARKQNSSLSGRSSLFVINDLFIVKGRSLDKITQAHTLESYPGLSQNLEKLTVSQYLAELVLLVALTNQPQVELYELLTEHLKRIEQGSQLMIAHLAQALFHILALTGIAPQVQTCCISKQSLSAGQAAGFSVPHGGTVTAAILEHLQTPTSLNRTEHFRTEPSYSQTVTLSHPAYAQTTETATVSLIEPSLAKHRDLNIRLNATELALLQRLAQPELPTLETVLPPSHLGQAWLNLEKILREYTQYHLDHPIRSAALIDTCFSSLPTDLERDNATV